MAGGFSSIGLGYLAFATIKFAGYSAAAYALNRSYDSQKHHFLTVGLVRTIIGQVFGVVLGLLIVIPLVLSGEVMILAFLALLIPVRCLEWWIVLRAFYDTKSAPKMKNWRNVAVATVWSFVLDFPAITGLVSTGGFWIC